MTIEPIPALIHLIKLASALKPVQCTKDDADKVTLMRAHGLGFVLARDNIALSTESQQSTFVTQFNAKIFRQTNTQNIDLAATMMGSVAHFLPSHVPACQDLFSLFLEDEDLIVAAASGLRQSAFLISPHKSKNIALLHIQSAARRSEHWNRLDYYNEMFYNGIATTVPVPPELDDLHETLQAIKNHWDRGTYDVQLVGQGLGGSAAPGAPGQAPHPH